jgi:hypothetical protein
MEKQIFLDHLVMRYLCNALSAEELEVFVFLFRQGKLDETFDSILDLQIRLETQKTD